MNKPTCFPIMSHNSDLTSYSIDCMALCFSSDRTRDKTWSVWVLWITAALLCLEFSYKYPIALRLMGRAKAAGTISFALL